MQPGPHRWAHHLRLGIRNNLTFGCRGDRIEVNGLEAYDVTRGAFYLGQSWMTNAHFKLNTTNSARFWSEWPWNVSVNNWRVWEVPAIRVSGVPCVSPGVHCSCCLCLCLWCVVLKECFLP